MRASPQDAAVLRALGESTSAGLTSAEVAQRRQVSGYNDLARARRSFFTSLLGSVVREPMFVLLLLAAALYVLIGDLGEGLMLGCFALLSVGLVIFQEWRSARALEALRELGAPKVRVQRDGTSSVIDARELVPGDTLLIGEGERVGADAVITASSGLSVDESMLTGESAPVAKVQAGPGWRTRARTREAQVGSAVASPVTSDVEDSQVYAGTLVIRGQAVAEVVAIGEQSQLGRIGSSLAGMDEVRSPLEEQIRRLALVFSVLAVASCAVLVLWYGVVKGRWLEGLLASIALGMSMLPEEFPMVLTVFFALGAWRMSRSRVLVRRSAVIEALGAATVLCLDKTGTMTENRMAVRGLQVAGSREMLPADRRERDARIPQLSPSARGLIVAAQAAVSPGSVDPMDLDIQSLPVERLGLDDLQQDWLARDRHLVRHDAMTPECLVMANLWRGAHGHWCAAKGAPEAVARLCRLGGDDRSVLNAQILALAEQGLRVIAVAQSRCADKAPAALQEQPLQFTGLLAFEDPLRPAVPPAIADARAAGIAVFMITGDHVATALAIARQAGIDVDGGVLDGASLDALGDPDLREAVRTVRVFARVRPQHKLRIVQALRANDEVVAMTGDGVNDAPALHAAHAGIAMGRRGTDVAREAAGIVLLDDDVSHVISGIRQGRKIYDNLLKAIAYIAAIHVPIAGLTLLPLLIGLPPLMGPVHVVLVEMVVDPMCSLAFESAPAPADLMRRPPRRKGGAVPALRHLNIGLVQGAFLLVATLAVYSSAVRWDLSVEQARTLALVALTAGNLMLVAQNVMLGNGWRALTESGAHAYWLVAGVTVALFAGLLAWTPGQALLRMAAPPPLALAAAVLAVLVTSLVAAQLSKRRLAAAPLHRSPGGRP